MQQMEPRGSVWKQARTELNDRKKEKYYFRAGEEDDGPENGAFGFGTRSGNKCAKDDTIKSGWPRWWDFASGPR